MCRRARICVQNSMYCAVPEGRQDVARGASPWLPQEGSPKPRRGDRNGSSDTCRPSGACGSIGGVFQGLTPLATSCRRYAAEEAFRHLAACLRPAMFTTSCDGEPGEVLRRRRSRRWPRRLARGRAGVQRQNVRDILSGVLFAQRVIVRRQQPAIEGAAEFRDPGVMKVVENAGLNPCPIMHWHKSSSHARQLARIIHDLVGRNEQRSILPELRSRRQPLQGHTTLEGQVASCDVPAMVFAISFRPT